MIFSKLLTRQIKHNLPQEVQIDPLYLGLLGAIDQSYEHYERDSRLSKQSLEISSDESRLLFSEINNKEIFLRTIIEVIPDGILVLNENDEIEMCNKTAAKDLFNENEEQIIGKNLTNLPFVLINHSLDSKTPLDLIQIIKKLEGPCEIEIKTADGTKKFYELILSNVFTSNKQEKVLLFRDISLHKESERQRVEAAKNAGIMQVLVSVLHNIGNILNSVNTSNFIIQEKISTSELEGLVQVSELLKSHKDDLVNFFSETTQGKCLPDYLTALAETWQTEKKCLLKESQSLTKNIDLIASIIQSQQKTPESGFVDKISVNSLINEVLELKSMKIKMEKIIIDRKYNFFEKTALNESKLFQIIENLIQNAIEALQESKNPHKIITVSTKLTDGEIQIDIQDNGIGIDSLNLTHLFSFGFTTKKSGHGIGLHMSALLSNELKGQLKGSSQGINQGATFTLTLPLRVS